MKETPLPLGRALRALARSVGTAAVLLARRAVHLPRRHVGVELTFADGTSARVCRETAVDVTSVDNPCVLLVEFRLRAVHGRGHAFFRAQSLLNTPLFVGFPGFVSKLWLAHDGHDVYRGLYEWDGPKRAESFARALWWVLALVSVRASIDYHVLPGLRCNDVLHVLTTLRRRTTVDRAQWWRPVAMARFRPMPTSATATR